MTEPERDAEVDAWLASRRSLQPAHEASHLLEPPPELDRIVIDRARLELRMPTSSKIAFFRNPRWTLPISIAATLLLSFTLVLQFNRYESRQDAAAARDTAPAAPIEMSDAPMAAAEPAGEKARMQAADSARPVSESQAAGELRPARALDHESRRRSRTDQLTADLGRVGVFTSADAVAPPDAAATARGAATAAAAVASSSASTVSDSRAELDSGAKDVAAGDSVVTSNAAPPPAAITGALRAAKAAAPAQAAAEASRTAASWWELVLKLRRDGHSAEAARELEALRKAHPDFVLPTTP